LKTNQIRRGDWPAERIILREAWRGGSNPELSAMLNRQSGNRRVHTVMIAIT
jgi:hypothetical protein